MISLTRPRLLLLALAILLSGCGPKEKAATKFGVGERVDLGPFFYVVGDTAWKSQLGEGFDVRSPQNRFLLVTVSVSNHSNSDVSVPLLTLQGSDGQQYKELSDGKGVPDWLGILRTVAPSQTLQGRILFDVPLSSFQLRLPDGAESGYEKYAWVDIPLRIDSDQVQVPLPALPK